MQRSTGFIIVLALIVGFVLFHVKYRVADAEAEFAKVSKLIKQERENMHILRAEWTYLNEPKRLQALAQKYLDIIPVKTEQVSTLMTAFDSNNNHRKSDDIEGLLASAKIYE